MAVEQRVDQAIGKEDMSLEDKVNKKLASQAEDGFYLKDMFVMGPDSVMLLFEKTDATQS
jgi:hypothetical protein